MSFKTKFEKFVETQVEAAILLIFKNAHGMAMTTSGESTAEQYEQTEVLQEQLKQLVIEQTLQNISVDKKKELGLCSNCNFDMGPAYENCGGAEDGVCPECGTDSELPLKQFNVPVMRTGYAHTNIAVSARTEQEAINLAIDEAGSESFSENNAEYEAPDGAIEIKDSNI